MKKILYTMLVAAMTAFSFASCEDVPAPYDMPNGGNGDTPSTVETPSGDGTQANPFNVLAANAFIEAGEGLDQYVYLKGKICSVKECSAQYGNATFYISEDGSTTATQFYVYRVKGLGNQKIASDDEVKVGDDVVVYAQLTNYNGTYETAQNTGYIYSLNGKTEGGSDTPDVPSTGEGSQSNPYNVTAAIAKASAKNVFVKGYIVGCINEKSLSSASFDTFTAQTNILIAESASETDASKCMPVQLPTGDIRNSLNLSANPSNLKQEVTLYGNIETYFGTVGLKTVTYAILGGKEIGKKPTPSTDEPTAGAIYSETFATGQGSFTIKDVDLGSLSYVWKHDTYNSDNYMKASAYANSTANAAESWLVSGDINLSKVTDATLSLDQAINKINEGKVADCCAILVSTNYSGDVKTATWEALAVDAMPEGTSWTFSSSKASLKKYVGKTIHIAFRYTSTTTVAPTWEVKNIVVK